MATMVGSVIERVNTVDENRQVLNELMRKNEFVEPSHKELNKLFTRLNADNARELINDLKCYKPDWYNKKVTDRLYGPVPGIPCGSWWGIRMDCSRDRMHDPFSASVQSGPVGAVSICTSHSNEDIDLGDMLTFTGQAYGNVEGYVEDKDQDEGNRSLILNFENRVPVRIIRSYNLSNEYSPKTGYRYDGLYMVVHYWIGIYPQSDTRCYKFALKRLYHQEPPPWKLQIPRGKSEPVTGLKRNSKKYNLLAQEGTASRNSCSNVNTNDTIISRCISIKKFYTRDRKMPKVVKSARKRPPRSNEISPVPEPIQSTSTSQGSMMLQVSPGRKIGSTDHRNIHVSDIVTRRVSKKLLNHSIDNKLLTDCPTNKLWNTLGVHESQALGNEGEEEGVKSQNTRLQNTNISIRTDLYDSSHNLKQRVKKCGPNSTHGPGIFKPRSLGVHRRELNFAGVDSSPGSSRTICSVKMERVKSIDNQIKKINLNNTLCQNKEKAVNVNAQSTIENADINAQEIQSTKDTKIVTSTHISETVSSEIEDRHIKDKDLENLRSPKTRCTYRIEHSYASQLPKSLAQNGNCRSLVSQTTNHEEETEKSRVLDSGNPRDEEKTEFHEAEASGSLTKETELMQIENESSRHSSPSHSPWFRGFGSPELSKSEAEGLRTEASMIMNSLTLEKMLNIINKEKSSPMAKMLISNVIGFPTTGFPLVFDTRTKTDTDSSNPLSKIGPEIEISPSNIRTQSWGRENAEISSTDDHQKSVKSNSRQFRCFENSRQQNIIEIVYAGEEQDEIQESTDTGSNSHTGVDQLAEFAGNSETTSKMREFGRKSNENLQLEVTENHNPVYALARYRDGHEFHSGEEEEDVRLRLGATPNSEESAPLKRKTRISRPEDTVDFSSSERIESVVEHCDKDKNGERSRSRLIMRGKRDVNSWKRNDHLLKKEEPPKPSSSSISKSLTSQTTDKTPKAQIITRSKCLRNSIPGQPVNGNLKPEDTTNGASNWHESPDDPVRISDEKSTHDSAIHTLGLRSAGRVQQSDKEIVDKKLKNMATDLKSVNFSTDKSPDNIRLIKRSGVRVRRKMEVANLFIDMNMSPRSQISKTKSRSRRSTLRGVNHLRRRSSCPAVVDRVLKRKNDDPVKHPTSRLKRLKKSSQIPNSSVQMTVTTKKGLSLRKRTKNGVSPTNNNNNNNNNSNNNNNCVRRIGKAEKVMGKIKKPIKSTARNIVAKKSNVIGLRDTAAAEIPKRREAAMRTRSGRSPRNLQTVGRLGLRRALITATETYGRKKMKKKKERQKQMVEEVKKQKEVSGKQSMPKRGHIQFALKNAKLDYNIYKGTREAKKPKMVSVMTQCSLISAPSQSSATFTRKNNATNLRVNTGYRQGSDCSSEFVCSSRNSGMDQVKNEIIELIEIKSEAFDDDVANCDEEDDENEEIRVQADSNSAFNPTSRRFKDLRSLDRSNTDGSLEVQGKSHVPSLRQLSQSLRAFSGDSLPRKGFIPYVAGRRPSAFVPIRSVEGNLKLAQLKSIGFKPIKPGHFPPDGFEVSSEYNRRSTSDSPRIAYSSAVVKRGVHEEYDKYTSEENNVVQYMDSKLCYEDIENEDFICGRRYSTETYRSTEVFVEKMEFVKIGTEIEEESSDNSPLGGEEEEEGEDEDEEEKEEEEEEEENDDDDAEDFENEDIKEWQSQLDANSSNSEDTEPALADSDGDMPWHGWKKIISNKQTYFVGW